MFEVKAIIRPQRLEDVRMALHEIAEMPGVTVSKVHAFARSHPRDTTGSVDALEADLVKLETVVPAALQVPHGDFAGLSVQLDLDALMCEAARIGTPIDGRTANAEPLARGLPSRGMKNRRR